uniref:Uncharacterized protein n=1 Tax=Tetranychus urticae TaxID=32264 RepID=T1JZJ1_TETUR
MSRDTQENTFLLSSSFHLYPHHNHQHYSQVCTRQLHRKQHFFVLS